MPRLTPRRRAAAALLGAVLLAHALLLWRREPADDARRPAAVRAALQTRQVAALPVATPSAADAPPALAAPRVARAAAPARRTAAAAPDTTVAMAPPSTAPTAAEPDPDAPPASSAAVDDARPPPVYPTRLPDSAHLRFRLQRGAAVGMAELRWTLDAGRYRLQVDGSAGAGLPPLAWDSSGTIDAAGVAPDRFVDRRRRRGAMAVNFQRDRGLITFSGPQLQLALPPGAQDRASWLAQLAAVVAADPARFVAGATIELFVAGARGDAETWVFGVEGVETLQLPAGTVPAALHLLREPRRAYDTRAEVWLDPARQHLPVRVRLQRVPTQGDATELLLLQDTPPTAP